jgi:hypothetical protein
MRYEEIKQAENCVKTKHNFKTKEGNLYGNAKYFMIPVDGTVFPGQQIYNTV